MITKGITKEMHDVAMKKYINNLKKDKLFIKELENYIKKCIKNDIY